MSWHEISKDGSMRMKIIVTFLHETKDKTITNMLELHEQKVNKFNDDNNVFFNQNTQICELGASMTNVYSVILYANGQRKKIQM